MTRKKLVCDVILIASLLLVALVAFFALRHGRTVGDTVKVSVDGVEVGSYPLDRDAVYTLNGGTNILVIEGGDAYMRHADCPDGICVKTGKIRYTGQRIVCLPNRVLVEITGQGEQILGG